MSISTVLPDLSGILPSSPSQGRTDEKRWKRIRSSSHILRKTQQVVRLQPRFLVMYRVEVNENLKRTIPFILKIMVSGSVKLDDSIIKLRDDTILIQTTADIQYSNIMALSKIPFSISYHLQEKVEPHRFLNDFKIMITCYELNCVKIEEICEKPSPQNVTEVYKITIKNKGQEKYTDMYILTFTTTTLTKEVRAGFSVLRVWTYVPNPRRCFGHPKLRCRGKPTYADCWIEVQDTPYEAIMNADYMKYVFPHIQNQAAEVVDLCTKHQIVQKPPPILFCAMNKKSKEELDHQQASSVFMMTSHWMIPGLKDKLKDEHMIDGINIQKKARKKDKVQQTVDQ
uniref:Uncharacterized protein n=1 Tax=Timema douglasi TaxID=61478 RepID=A0A7R8VUD0_TIMDO|nr:unnamed protein product [Timema douglasi]